MMGQLLWHDDVRRPPKCPVCEGHGEVPNPLRHPDDVIWGPYDGCGNCGGTGSEWLWARTNDQAKRFLESARYTIRTISMDHDLGGHALDPDAPGAFYYRGSVEDDGKRLAEWMVETGNVPDTIIIHSWSPDGVERIKGVFLSAAKHDLLPGQHTLKIERAVENA